MNLSKTDARISLCSALGSFVRSTSLADFLIDGLSTKKFSCAGCAMFLVLGNWAKKDSLAAGTWLNEQPAGPRLDSALASYASTVSRDDAGSAMEWAVSISEEKLQQKTIRSVGQEWYRQDKESVEAWLPQSGLSEDLQKSIRNPPKKNWWQSLRDL